ncbi:MAG: 3-keto-5-aminohexanoate cleavage protein [Shimia sp.]|uniref:3-keto-5-aminohexanoate cleavage protein n=1 Tax=Shimia sp. TaxID=1954381 RepID=UPI004058FC5A
MPRNTAYPNPAKTRITVAPNGARRQKTDHAALPLTIFELAKTARDCQAAGAGMIHLHVRDANRVHSLDADLYRNAIAEIASQAPELDVQITTESGGLFDVEDQLACLRALRPAAASISVREIMRAPDLAPRIYATAAESGTEVQHILYDTDDLAILRRMIDAQIVPDHIRDILLVLGRYNPPRPARVSELAPFVTALAGDFPNWTACAFGANEHTVMLEAARLGGDVRIGFENNICRPDGTLAADNAENIARFVAAHQTQAIQDPAQKEPPQ